MAQKKDYYQILGVSKDASDSEIKKVYRKLARQYHPDVNPGDKTAEDKFKEIQDAYEVLGNKDKRAKYDKYGHMAFEPGFDEARGAYQQYQHQWPGGGAYDFGSGGPFGGGGFQGVNDFGDMFNDLFRQSGRARRPAGPQKGGNLEYSLEIDFMTAAKGGSTRISMQKESACDNCGGTGQQPGTSTQRCQECGGAGMKNIAHGPLNFSQPCHNCGGTGQIITNPCSSCQGQGGVLKTERMDVKIPAGVKDGSRIRLSGKGRPGLPGGPPGDLYIVVKVAKHPYFKREGDDIYLDVPISISEAALGAKVVIPTIDGKTSLSIPPGIQSGQKLRLAGKGVYGLKGKKRGDHFAVVKIVPPKKLDPKAAELIKEFANIQTENPRASTGW